MSTLTAAKLLSQNALHVDGWGTAVGWTLTESLMALALKVTKKHYHSFKWIKNESVLIVNYSNQSTDKDAN